MDKRWWYGLTVVVCAPAALAQEAPDAAELRDYVRKLEGRVADLEREREWPLDAARAQSPSALEAAVRSVNLTGYMEFVYAYNLRPGGGTAAGRGDTLGFNQLRGPDADVNGFSFQNLELLADRPLAADGSTGFHVRLSYGVLGTIAHADPNFDGGPGGNAFDVREAYFSWRAPFDPTGHVDLSVGKFRTPLGFEALENTDNWTVTRNPIAVFGTPVTHTGLRATLPVSEKFAANLYLVNGWDAVRAPNDGKTVIANLVLGRFDTLSSQIQLNASYGSVSTPGAPQGDKIRLVEVVWDGKLSDPTEFALDLLAARGPARSWRGAAAYVRHHATDTFWISGRAGWYADDALGTNGARILDGTLAVGCDVAKDLTVALEYRHDFSRSDGTYLSSSGGACEHQDTLTASFLYRF